MKPTVDRIGHNSLNQVTTIGAVSMTYRDLGNDLRQNAGGLA